MADPKLVRLLKRSIKGWEEWREGNSIVIYPDLSNVNLSNTNLSNVDLSNANLNLSDMSYANLRNARLRGANLSGANLRRADLTNADLCGAELNSSDLSNTSMSYANLGVADLRNADLNGADLSNANLSNANLNCANLSYAYLGGTNLSGTNLSGVNLIGSRMWETAIAEVDLRSAKGLIEIVHQGPSIIQLHTVLLPPDGSALRFLRGVGIPDEWIDEYLARMIHPIQYHSCFISYSHKDASLAQRLHTDLQGKGVRCWFASHDMHIGDKIRPRIDEAIHLQDKLLLILSEQAVNSDWVEHEVETALARERRDKRTILFPIRLDNSILERPYTGWAATVQNERHIGDFTGWKDHDRYHAAFDRLIRDLKKADE